MGSWLLGALLSCPLGSQYCTGRTVSTDLPTVSAGLVARQPAISIFGTRAIYCTHVSSHFPLPLSIKHETLFPPIEFDITGARLAWTLRECSQLSSSILSFISFFVLGSGCADDAEILDPQELWTGFRAR